MTKIEFLNKLREKLNKFSADQIEDLIIYYTEIIDDKIDTENMTEVAAVESLGNINTIARQCSIGMMAEVKKPETKSVTKNALGNISSVIGMCFASTIFIPLGFAMAIVYFTLCLTGVILVVSFAFAGIAALIVPLASFFYYLGIGPLLAMIGICFITSAVMFGLCYIVAVYGLKLINFINHKMAKLITKKRS